MGQKTDITLRFPVRGVDGSTPLSVLPEGSCPEMLNVYPFAASRTITATPDVAANRLVGAKRPGAEDSAAIDTANRACVGLRVWKTIYRPTALSNNVDPITLLISFDSSQHVQISKVTNGVPGAFGSSITPSVSTNGELRRPTFAPLGTNLYLLGDTNTNGSANGHVLSAYAVTPGGTGIPTSMAGWSVDAIVKGANICCTYRARAVIASAGESLWVMSKVGDATNWTEDQLDKNSAYRGNSTGSAGVPGDGITALIPFGDEYMIFGALASIWMLTGDPRNGGRVVELSRNVGIYNRVSWCFDPQGTLWFLGSDFGLYKLEKGSRVPVEVLHGRCDHLLRDIIPFASEGRTAYLEYDVRRSAVMIMVTTTAPSAGVAYPSVAYFTKLDAPFPILFSYSSTTGSHCCMFCADWGDIYVGFNASGGSLFPVKVMKYINPTFTDSGTNFTCLIKFGAIEPGGDNEWTAKRLTATGSMSSGAATWYWLKARSADELQQLTYTTNDPATGYSATGTFFTTSGFQAPVGLRQTAAVHQLVIAQTSSAQFRLENFGVEFESAGIRRYGQSNP